MCYVSACIHDVGHPGFTNNYLINTRDTLAIRYNDIAVLENFHISLAFEIMQVSKNDIFKNFSTSAYKGIRQAMIEMVLATDMSRHFDFLSSIKTQFAGNEFEEDDKPVILEYLLHAADISNCSKPWKISRIWSEKVLSEYFLQGD